MVSRAKRKLKARELGCASRVLSRKKIFDVILLSIFYNHRCTNPKHEVKRDQKILPPKVSFFIVNLRRV
jgi:hypothetical protein